MCRMNRFCREIEALPSFASAHARPVAAESEIFHFLKVIKILVHISPDPDIRKPLLDVANCT